MNSFKPSCSSSPPLQMRVLQWLYSEPKEPFLIEEKKPVEKKETQRKRKRKPKRKTKKWKK